MSDAVSTGRGCLGCDFAVFSDGFDTDELSRRTGIEADWSLPPVPARLERRGLVREQRRRGCWLIRSNGRITSEDVNVHLRYLLALLLPHREAIAAASDGGATMFSVQWAGTVYPYHSGPCLAADCVAGIAELRAEISITWRSGHATDA